MANIDEEGAYVNSDGMIIVEWPPKGRWKVLWDYVNSVISDDEKLEVLKLLSLWREEESTLVSYTEDLEWVDVEPDWTIIEQWREEE